MTREIKFRAWDEYAKIMLDSWQLSIHADKVFVQKIKGGDGYPTDVKLMQFTGLLDKNGKEVYEGDILATFEDEDNPNYDGKPSKWIQVIRYDEEHAQFIVIEEEVLTVLETTYEPQVADISLGYDEIEVIGNVYEKEKLLK